MIFILCLLYIVFFYFTHNILYSSSHFTGGSRVVPKLYRIISVIYILLELAFIIILAIKVSVILAIVLFVITFIILNIVKLIVNKIVMEKVTKEMQSKDFGSDRATYWGYYNRQLDVATSEQAFIGFIVNPIIIVLYFVLF